MEFELWRSVLIGDMEEVRRLLKTPTIDVNWKNDRQEDEYFKGTAALHHTFGTRNEDLVISKMLLAHPDIDVNIKTAEGDTPFMRMQSVDYVLIGQEFLKDARVNINQLTSEGKSTPCWRYQIDHILLQIMIASGRELEFGKPGDKLSDPFVTAGQDDEKVISLLESYQKNPDDAVRRAREELGISGKRFSFLVTIFTFW